MAHVSPPAVAVLPHTDQRSVPQFFYPLIRRPRSPRRVETCHTGNRKVAPISLPFGWQTRCRKKSCDLGNYVIMPNHVHLLVTPRLGFSLSNILQAWKGFTAKEINKRLGTKGTKWLDESFDHIVRNSHQLVHFQDYIRQNPLKAGLKPGQFLLGCGTDHNVVQASPPASAGVGQ